jgi:hypothetical protein
MQATLLLRQSLNLNSTETPSASHASSEANSVTVEIHAYLAARNLLLREAEKNTTEINLRRAAAANEFAENCLLPGRSPMRRRHCRKRKRSGNARIADRSSCGSLSCAPGLVSAAAPPDITAVSLGRRRAAMEPARLA